MLKWPFFSCICFRLPVVSECSPQQTARVSVAAGSSGSVSAAASAAAAAAVVAGAPSSSTMSVSRVPSPPPSSEANTPVAENWCYTQVRTSSGNPFWHFVDYNKEIIIKCFHLPHVLFTVVVTAVPRRSQSNGFLEEARSLKNTGETHIFTEFLAIPCIVHGRSLPGVKNLAATFWNKGGKIWFWAKMFVSLRFFYEF